MKTALLDRNIEGKFKSIYQSVLFQKALISEFSNGSVQGSPNFRLRHINLMIFFADRGNQHFNGVTGKTNRKFRED